MGESESRTRLGGCKASVCYSILGPGPQGLFGAPLPAPAGLFMTTGGERGGLGTRLVGQHLLPGLRVHPAASIPARPRASRLGARSAASQRVSLTSPAVPKRSSIRALPWLMASLNSFPI